ncbi:putative lipoprotein [Labilithrix luteola]|uniref:Putative lipoprotein n=1 Tax=Labilithrix luteola TaxID=1391654 RepID=A0A0K1Q194_9BACT|nr:hypothetical protein [Labilithrix luteola]AKU99396.1 putative lipoprotein [Labilithrix luteola]
MTQARIRPAVLFAAMALALAASPGCKKTVGSACKANEALCEDPKSALSCQGGKFVEVSCNGPLGCTKYQDKTNCDTSVGTEGAPCMGETDEQYACTPDKKRALLCKGGHFERYLECRGKAGCSLLGQQVSCDTSVANKGDPCKKQGAVACTEDQKQMVICRDGKFDSYRFCRGRFGCYSKDDAPTCDESIALEGDPCGIPGFLACSVDGKTELACQGGVFGFSRACKKSGCVVTNRPGRAVDCQ